MDQKRTQGKSKLHEISGREIHHSHNKDCPRKQAPQDLCYFDQINHIISLIPDKGKPIKRIGQSSQGIKVHSFCRSSLGN